VEGPGQLGDLVVLVDQGGQVDHCYLEHLLVQQVQRVLGGQGLPQDQVILEGPVVLVVLELVEEVVEVVVAHSHILLLVS